MTTLPTLLGKSALSSVNLETLARMEVRYQQRRADQKTIAAARDYYRGDHPTSLSDRQRQFLGMRGKVNFCANYCRLVVDAVAERLKVVGFEATDSALKGWLWELWNTARLDALSQRLHLAAVRDGEAYLVLDFDSQADRPRFTLQLADDGSGGISVGYDDEGNMAYAAKRWWSEGPNGQAVRRMTLYYPDRIEKYISHSAAPYWQPYHAAGESFPIAWVDHFGDPLGLPVIAFTNRDGDSELTDVIPLQDALNKTLLDLIAVADTNAFPLLVAQGFEVPSDLIIGPGSLIQIPPSMDGQSDFRMVAGANLQNFIALLQSLVMEVARVSSTPLSRFQASGQVAAEGTLKQQEAGLISKVEQKQVIFGNAWEDAMRLAIRLQNTFGVLPLEESAELSTLWSPAAPRSEADQLQVLLLKAQLGVPAATLLAEAGYTV